MIVWSRQPLELGRVYVREATNVHGETQPAQPFYIIREATQAEWEECLADGGGDVEASRPAVSDNLVYFYKVHTD